MKTSILLSTLALALVSNAATIPTSASTWTTLTATDSVPTSVGALTSFDGSFAISLVYLSSASATASSKAKRDVLNQISDGQVQQQTTSTAKTTASVIAQISDGQVQAQTTAAAETTASVLAQIGDGQVQAQTTASVLAQIGDGQVQEQTTAALLAQIGDGQVQEQTTTAAKTTATVLAQIGDGQVQQQTTAATKTTASVVAQISDGQVQQQTTTAKNTASVVAQISDGQVQQQSTTATTANQVSQISDGQIQATGSATSSSSSSSSEDEFEETCALSNSLILKLADGILTDSSGRIGAIVANRQFQFDGPPPQAGTIYAKGWSIVPLSYDGKSGSSSTSKRSATWGKLALGDQTTFYRCLSGDFYNLYDQSIGGQCSEVEFSVLRIVDC